VTNLLLFLRLSRPWFLFGGALNYFLGLGILRYLGFPIDWGVALLGQVWVTSLQLSTHYLNEYFDYPSDSANRHRTPFTGGSGVLGTGPGQLRPRVALVAAFCALTAVALAMAQNLPILVFSLRKKGNIQKAIFRGNVGTLISGGPHEG